MKYKRKKEREREKKIMIEKGYREERGVFSGRGGVQKCA